MAGSRNCRKEDMNNRNFQSDGQALNPLNKPQEWSLIGLKIASYTGFVLSRVWNNECYGWWDYVEFRKEAGERGRWEGQEWRIKSSFGGKVFDRTGRNYQLVTQKNVGPQCHKRPWEATVGGFLYNDIFFLYPQTQMHASHPFCFLASGKQLWLGNDQIWQQIIIHNALKELILVKQQRHIITKWVCWNQHNS